MASAAITPAEADDGGLAVVRVKPLGAGGGGGERSAKAAAEAAPSGGVEYSTDPPSLTVGGRTFSYPSHVIAPEMGQQELYASFMPARVNLFMNGTDVNVMAYGQTGSGKTHTMFGPPGIMARAAAGEYGDRDCCPDYGLFPRGLLAVFEAVEELRRSSSAGGAGAGAMVALTASAVELSFMGNVDMLARADDMAARRRAAEAASGGIWAADSLGVALDKAAAPPRLYGMTELPLESAADLRTLYAALATRNTAATLMNNSSSRTHCFAFLTLRVVVQNPKDCPSSSSSSSSSSGSNDVEGSASSSSSPDDSTGVLVRTSRFQFVDLAGSERLKDAHGAEVRLDWGGGGEAMTGLLTNQSLSMLGSCVRALIEHNAKHKGKTQKKNSAFSFRTFLFDLVFLLRESMTGAAATACFVCLSQAPDNLPQSKFALDFGESFAKLPPRPRANRPQPRTALLKAARKMVAEADRALAGSGGGKFRAVREAQKRDGEQQLRLLASLAPSPKPPR